jgi:hypothetical protein
MLILTPGVHHTAANGRSVVATPGVHHTAASGLRKLWFELTKEPLV